MVAKGKMEAALPSKSFTNSMTDIIVAVIAGPVKNVFADSRSAVYSKVFVLK